ncbi:WhiB family transcriptional regulator [Streptomyces sp. NPDC004237]|uniref:WhiB family transcriptional regulator n=1 Tax=Streptomyces sp. NPDC004237 TaxID=3154455 RepID=UPI0033B4E984
MTSGPRTSPTVAALADKRIPFPRTLLSLPCRDDPAQFAFEDVTDARQRELTLARAKHTCSGCPVVHSCLKWALANPSLTRRGVWAATTPSKRRELRKRLVIRLGDDWVGVLADRDRRAPATAEGGARRHTARDPSLGTRPAGAGIHPHRTAATRRGLNRSRLHRLLREPPFASKAQ